MLQSGIGLTEDQALEGKWVEIVRMAFQSSKHCQNQTETMYSYSIFHKEFNESIYLLVK